MKQILIIALLGIPLLTRLFFYYDSRPAHEEGDQFQAAYNFLQEPKKNAFSQYFFIDNIFVSLPLYPSFSYGDKVEISGTLKKLPTDNGELLTIESPLVVKIEDDSPFITVAKFIRGRVEESVVTSLPQREGGLLLGIVLGVRDKIDQEFYEKLRTSGVLHVVAASGQNVSILAAILLISVQKIVKRRQAILFTGIGILIYAGLAGFDPPIVRASFMALISFGAVALGRQTAGMFALLLTGWGMVMWEPKMLEDISFQLSFLATWGIMAVKPLLDQVLKFKIFSLLKEDLTTTLSAQIATFPLILGAFGSYSVVSLFSNVLVLWTIPPIMILGIIGALFSLLHPLLALPFLYLSYPFLIFFTTIIELTSHFDVLLSVESLPQPLIYGYYVILFGIVLGLKRRGGQKI